MPFPLISVITVTFNPGQLLPYTLENIACQTYQNIEVIVVDGASSDGTADFLKNYKKQSIKYVTESDKGIYDAMNKGMAMATGDYVIFINAGDGFYENKTLEKVFAGEDNLCDVYFGNTMMIDEAGNELGLRRLQPPSDLSWRSLINGMLVCHQSIFVRKPIAPNYKTNLSVAADYQWVLESLKRATTVKSTDIIISLFLDGGFNKKHILQSLQERFSVMCHYYGFFPTLFNHIRIGVRFFIFLLKNKRF
jgi:glycosyltransferase involved in cell wall biosynthesis